MRPVLDRERTVAAHSIILIVSTNITILGNNYKLIELWTEAES